MGGKMTLTMEFKRDVPDDRTELLLTVHARDLAAALRTLDEHLRRRLRDEADLPREARDELDRARTLLRAELGWLADPVLG